MAFERRAFMAAMAGLGATLSAACIPDGRLKLPVKWTPAAIAGDWQIASPAAVGLDIEAVREAYRAVFDPGRMPNIRSLLIARHGHLVGEGYIADPRDRTRQAALMSATKSVTSLLAGVALERGHLASLDVTTGELFPELKLSGKPAAIKLRDALTMRAGLDYSNDDFSLDMEWGEIKDSIAHVLEQAMGHTPGTYFDYTDACAHLAGSMVARGAGANLADYGRDHLFSPAGIRDFKWLAHADGRNFGAYGLFLTPRDLLRLGQLAFESLVADTKVVSRAWMAESTTHQVDPDFGEGFGFGYLWWTSPDGDAFTAHGHGGQFAYCVPDLALVLAVTADPNSNENLVSVSGPDLQELAQILRAGAYT